MNSIKASWAFCTSLVLLLTLAGCGSGSSSVGGGPGGGGSGPPSGSEFLYQISFADDTYVSTVNPSTGVLSQLTDAAPNLSVESAGLHPLVTPFGEFLYIQGFDQNPAPPVPPVNAIYCFSITGSKGELTSLPGSPSIATNLKDPGLFIGLMPTGIAMDGHGRFFYLSDYDGTNPSGQSINAIRAYTIDATSGALENGPILTSTSVAQLSVQAIDPASKYLYAATVLSDSLAISVYAIDPTTEVLTEVPGSPFFVINTTEGVEYNLSLFTSSSGNFLYASVTNYTSGSPGVFTFSVDPATGALAVVAGSPFSVGDGVAGTTLHPSGKFLYATETQNGAVAGLSVFAVDTTNGTIGTTPVSSVAISDYFGLSLIDPSGQVLVFNDSNNTALSFTVNGSTGSLTAAAGSPFGVASQWETAIIVKIP